MNNKDEIIKKLQIKNGKLQILIERLKLDKEEYYLDYLNLQTKIDKAIKHIETHSKCGGSIQNGKFIIEYIEEVYNGMKLLSILEGEDNDI